MPIYEYVCGNCQEKFEKLVRMGASEEEIECPRCSGHEVKKALSVFSTTGASSGSSTADVCAPSG